MYAATHISERNFGITKLSQRNSQEILKLFHFCCEDTKTGWARNVEMFAIMRT